MKYLIWKIDLFGKYYIFQENRSPRYTTKLGITITFLILISCTIIGFLIGKEIYLRKNPTVISGEEMIENSLIKTTDYPILFSFMNGKGIGKINPNKTIITEMTFMTISSNYTIGLKYLPLHSNCSGDNFPGVYKDMVNELIEINAFDYYCIQNKDAYILNDYSVKNSAFINIRFRICNKELNECSSTDEEYNEILNDLYVVITTVESYLNPADHNDPIKYYFSTTSQQVGLNLLKRTYYTLEKKLLSTEEGWVLENNANIEFITKSKEVKEINTSSDGNIFWVTFISSQKRGKTERSYMKIQDLLAKIGGLFNALYLVFYALICHYVNFSFYKYIYKHFKIDDKMNVDKSKGYSSNKNKHLRQSIEVIVKKLVKNNLNNDECNDTMEYAKNNLMLQESFYLDYSNKINNEMTNQPMNGNIKDNREEIGSKKRSMSNRNNDNNSNIKEEENNDNPKFSIKIKSNPSNISFKRDINSNMPLYKEKDSPSNAFSEINIKEDNNKIDNRAYNKNDNYVENNGKNNFNRNNRYNRSSIMNNSSLHMLQNLQHKRFSLQPLNLNNNLINLNNISNQVNSFQFNNNDKRISLCISNNNRLEVNKISLNDNFLKEESNSFLRNNSNNRSSFALINNYVSQNKRNSNMSSDNRILNISNSFSQSINNMSNNNLSNLNINKITNTPIKDSNNNINSSINQKTTKSNRNSIFNIFSQKFSELGNNLKQYFIELNYFVYIWNDIFCRKGKMNYQREAVRKVLSFNHLLELSYEYYINNEVSNIISQKDLKKVN